MNNFVTEIHVNPKNHARERREDLKPRRLWIAGFARWGIIAVEMTAATGISIAQITVTLIGMFVGPWLAVRWSLKQFRQNKWWEEKGQVYRTLLEDLSWLRQQNIIFLQAAEEGEEYSASEYINNLEREVRQRINRCIGFSSYLISKDAAKALEDAIQPTGDGDLEYFDDAIGKCDRALSLIREEASLEIRPANGLLKS